MPFPVDPVEIQRAGERLGSRVHRTPLLSFATAGKRRGGRLFLKCENLQKIGAFKARGALNYISCLDPQERRTLVTYSSGNHGAAVSWAAAQVGASARVFVPEDAPANKRAAIEGYGGVTVTAGRTSVDRRLAAEAYVAEEGGHIVPPFDHRNIIAGQGTVGLEIVEQLEGVDRVIVPVGGGGLIAGVATAIKAHDPGIQVIGVEPIGAASMAGAMQAGEPVDIELGDTVADGLRPVRAGSLTSQVVKECVDRLVTVSDAAIVDALWLLFERAHLGVEPSGAAALAAYLEDESIDATGNTVVVLSGGNIDRYRLNSLLESRSP